MAATQSRVPRLGPRGEGWVVLQAMFLFGTLVSAIVFRTDAPSSFRALSVGGGCVLTLAGLAVGIAGLRVLGFGRPLGIDTSLLSPRSFTRAA